MDIHPPPPPPPLPLHPGILAVEYNFHHQNSPENTFAPARCLIVAERANPISIIVDLHLLRATRRGEKSPPFCAISSALPPPLLLRFTRDLPSLRAADPSSSGTWYCGVTITAAPTRNSATAFTMVADLTLYTCRFSEPSADVSLLVLPEIFGDCCSASFSVTARVQGAQCNQASNCKCKYGHPEPADMTMLKSLTAEISFQHNSANKVPEENVHGRAEMGSQPCTPIISHYPRSNHAAT